MFIVCYCVVCNLVIVPGDVVRTQESEDIRRKANDFASVLREEIEETVRRATEDARREKK